MRRIIPTVLLFAAMFSCSSGTHSHLVNLSGQTMGTTYHIRAVVTGRTDPLLLKSGVDSLLQEINRQMSSWDNESEISRFNVWKSDTPFPVSPEFFRVLQISRQLSELTAGAFDVTIAPAVQWWGFGPAAESEKRAPFPDSLRGRIGYDHLRLMPGGRLQKAVPDLKIDVNAVAKGFGVDCVADYLQQRGIGSCLVEIGGELVAHGRKPDGSLWRVGVDRPEDHAAPGKDLSRILELSNCGIATSGDYRNYHMEEGRRHSHIIDPRTLAPTEHSVASVTVIDSSCAMADGLATALSVLGTRDGLELVNRLEGTEAYFIERDSLGNFREYFSNGFRQYLSRKERD